MRITGGRLRGRVLRGRVQPGVRPTSARVREALFSVLGQDLSGWSVLDGFGGSGILAFEAVSRGAGPVVVVEQKARVARGIQAEAKALGVELDVRVGDLRQRLGADEYDVVLLNPPYADDPVEWATLAAPHVRHCLVVEHRSDRELPDTLGQLELVRARTYGDTGLSVYRPHAPGPDERAVAEEADSMPLQAPE